MEMQETVRANRRLLDKFLEEGRIIYGVTTGFGENVRYTISPEDANTLQENIVRTHSVAVGEPLTREQVRASMLMTILNTGNCDAAIISQFESIVSTRYASPLTLKDIAKELNIGCSYLSTLVNKVLQKRFGQYLIETRFNASLPLLRNSNLSIAEIAHQVGFADQSHFSKSFRSIYHPSPQQYRKSDQSPL